MGYWHGYLRGADLHTAQLMPLPLTVSCFSKILTGFTFLVPAHPGSPGKRAVKWVLLLFCLQCFDSQVTFPPLPQQSSIGGETHGPQNISSRRPHLMLVVSNISLQ